MLFARGAESKYIQARNEPEILALFPQAQIETIPAAGHWLHAEQPQALLKAVNDFLAA